METTPSPYYWLYLIAYIALMIAPSIVAVIYVAKTPQDRIRTFPFLNVDFKIFWMVIAIMGTFVGAFLTLILARLPIPLFEREAMKREADEKKHDALKSNDSKTSKKR